LLGNAVEEAVLIQTLNLESTMEKWFEQESSLGESRDDYLTVLRSAKELFNGDLAALVLQEDDALVVFDDQGRTSSVRSKAETGDAFNLLNLANDPFQLSNPGILLLAPFLGEGEELKSLMLKVISIDSMKQGLFLVGSKSRNSFSRQENQFLGLFVANLNLTWRNHQLSTQVNRMSQALVALQEIGSSIGTNDYEKFIELVLQKMTQLIGAENGGIMLFDEDKQELVLQSPSFGAHEKEINQYRLSVRPDRYQELRTLEVFLERKSFISNNAPTEKKYLQQFIKLFRIRQSLDVPLFIDQKGIGVLHLVNKHLGFTEQDVQLLSVLTTKLAVLIDNARLIYKTKQQEREARALLQAGIDIFAFLDLKALLPSVVDKACLLLACDMAAITLLEEEGQYAHLTYGTRDAVEEVRYIKVIPGKGLTGQVLSTHHPLTCVMETQPTKLIREYDDIDLMVRDKEMSFALAVPLLIGSKIHGVLYCWRKKEESFFNPLEIKLLAKFSNQVMIALQNAKFYSGQRESLVGLQTSKQFMETQHTMLARSVSIHKELTQKALQGQGIKSMAGTLAQLVNGQVKVTDRFFRLLACCSKDPVNPVDSVDEAGDRVTYLYNPTELVINHQLREFFEKLVVAKLPMRLPSKIQKNKLPNQQRVQGFNGGVVAPIVVDTEALGYIFIQETGKSLEEIDLIALEHVSSFIALEMMKEKIKFEVINRLKGDCLDDLLSGNYKSEQEILDRANYLGYDLAKPFQVMVLNIDDLSNFGAKQLRDEGFVTRIKQRLFETVNNLVMAASPKSITTRISDMVVILTYAGDQGNEKCRDNICPLDLANEIKDKLHLVFSETPVSIGVGKVAHQLKDIPESHQEANTCLKILKKIGHKNRVVTFEQLGIYWVLNHVNNLQELSGFVGKMLKLIIAYDTKNGTMLVDTLRCYLDNNCNLQRTARASHLHTNTLNYRLKRIKELANLDLNDPEQRLSVQVALKILDILPQENS